MDQRKLWIEKLQEEAEIPEIVYQKAEQAFESIRMGQSQADLVPRKRKSGIGRKKAAILILAAVLLLSTLTAGAATYFHWNNRFTEEYDVTARMEKKLNDSGTAKEIRQYTEHDGIRIEAVQSVADNNVAHIVLKIYGSEEFPFQSRMNFGDIDVQVEGMNGVSWAGEFLEPQLSYAQPEKEWNDGAVYEIVLVDQEWNGLLNKEVKLTFTDIRDASKEMQTLTEQPALLESVWELSVVLDQEDTGKVYEVNQQIPGTDAVVKQIRLSSVSCVIDYEWKYQTKQETYVDENGETGTFEHMISPPEFMGVVYEDGNVAEHIADSMNGHFINEEKTEYRAAGALTSMIEYEDIKELIFYVENDIGMESEKAHVPVS